jgi:hypothetical protein
MCNFTLQNNKLQQHHLWHNGSRVQQQESVTPAAQACGMEHFM